MARLRRRRSRPSSRSPPCSSTAPPRVISMHCVGASADLAALLLRSCCIKCRTDSLRRDSRLELVFVSCRAAAATVFEAADWRWARGEATGPAEICNAGARTSCHQERHQFLGVLAEDCSLQVPDRLLARLSRLFNVDRLFGSQIPRDAPQRPWMPQPDGCAPQLQAVSAADAAQRALARATDAGTASAADTADVQVSRLNV